MTADKWHALTLVEKLDALAKGAWRKAQMYERSGRRTEAMEEEALAAVCAEAATKLRELV